MHIQNPNVDIKQNDINYGTVWNLQKATYDFRLSLVKWWSIILQKPLQNKVNTIQTSLTGNIFTGNILLNKMVVCNM